MLLSEDDNLPDLPSSAHNAIAVSIIEFCQHPFEPCENNSHSFAFVICSAFELDSASRARLVS